MDISNILPEWLATRLSKIFGTSDARELVSKLCAMNNPVMAILIMEGMISGGVSSEIPIKIVPPRCIPKSCTTMKDVENKRLYLVVDFVDENGTNDVACICIDNDVARPCTANELSKIRPSTESSLQTGMIIPVPFK